MEFWGVEVKPGETVKCEPGDDKYIHLSQACLGETKKPNENVPLYVKCDDKKLLVGTLSGEKFPQIQYDLVFEKDFELSHSSKNASVYFCGYKTIINEDTGDMFDDMSDESEEEEPIEAVPIKAPALNGKPKAAEKAKADGPKKADASKPKPDDKGSKPKIEDDSDDSEDDDDDGDDDDSDEDDEDDSDEEPKELKMMEVDDDEDDSDDDEDEDEDDEDESDEEEEATPQKTDSKKRPLKDSQKTPGQENKKAKLVSPAGAQKTDGKKGGHVATPHPAKQAPKTPAATNDKAKKPQTPKSGGSVACKSCSKTFNSENALQSHTKAKHA